MTTRCLPRRSSGYLLLVFIFGLGLASTGAQCSRSGDVVLAPESYQQSSENAGIGFCVSACAKEAADRRAGEKDRFLEAIQGCEPGSDCRAREAALHVSIVQQIQEEARVCMASCHNQGSGTGGQ